MNTIIEDDRTVKQHNTHDNLVIAYDGCLSGWGGAEDKASFAAWACIDSDLDKVEAWVENRSDMSDVEIITDVDSYKPQTEKHIHVYVVGSGHPALCQREEV